MGMRTLIVGVFALWASGAPAFAELSRSEIIAKTESGVTATDKRLHRTGCRFSPKRTGATIEVAQGVKLKIVTLEDWSILPITLMVLGKKPGKYAISQYQFLPNGGISGKDTCGSVTVDGFPRARKPGDPILSLGLRFRSNLDLLDLYPNTGKILQKRGQLLKVEAGRFAVVNLRNARHKRWYETFGGSWPQRAVGKFGMQVDDLHYIPVR